MLDGGSGSGLFDKLSGEEAQAVQDARLGKRELFDAGNASGIVKNNEKK